MQKGEESFCVFILLETIVFSNEKQGFGHFRSVLLNLNIIRCIILILFCYKFLF